MNRRAEQVIPILIGFLLVASTASAQLQNLQSAVPLIRMAINFGFAAAALIWGFVVATKFFKGAPDAGEALQKWAIGVVVFICIGGIVNWALSQQTQANFN